MFCPRAFARQSFLSAAQASFPFLHCVFVTYCSGKLSLPPLCFCNILLRQTFCSVVRRPPYRPPPPITIPLFCIKRLSCAGIDQVHISGPKPLYTTLYAPIARDACSTHAIIKRLQNRIQFYFENSTPLSHLIRCVKVFELHQQRAVQKGNAEARPPKVWSARQVLFSPSYFFLQ
jgi:hypothetical protein